MQPSKIKDTSALYHDLSEDLSRFLLSKSQDMSLNEDIMQETFIKLHLSLVGGKSIQNPKSWLFTVAQNALIDHYRVSKKQFSIPEQTDEVYMEAKPAHTPADCLRGIVASLPYKYKKAVYLVDIKGLRQTDAAEHLGLALPTFKSQVQRGRKLVAQGYVDCCDYQIKEDGTLQGEVKDWEECKVCNG